MNLSKENLSEIFQEISEQDEDYREAMQIVKSNCSGDIYLIGGYLFKTIVKSLYGKITPSKDYDFLFASPPREILLPEGWSSRKNRFGNLKFLKKNHERVDFIPLNSVYFLKERDLEYNIKNYLEYVPLNVHALAFNIFTKEITGKAGILSLEQKIVRVNCWRSAEEMAKRYKEKYSSVEDLILGKAQELGFKPELSS
jgi:hypothetical protein